MPVDPIFAPLEHLEQHSFDCVEPEEAISSLRISSLVLPSSSSFIASSAKKSRSSISSPTSGLFVRAKDGSYP